MFANNILDYEGSKNNEGNEYFQVIKKLPLRLKRFIALQTSFVPVSMLCPLLRKASLCQVTPFKSLLKNLISHGNHWESGCWFQWSQNPTLRGLKHYPFSSETSINISSFLQSSSAEQVRHKTVSYRSREAKAVRKEPACIFKGMLHIQSSKIVFLTCTVVAHCVNRVEIVSLIG